MLSLWVVVKGKVYDVTNYISRHPGGAAVLMRFGGADATEAFVESHKGSLLAPAVLRLYRIGTVLYECRIGTVSCDDDDDLCSALASEGLSSEYLSGDDAVVCEGDEALSAIAGAVYRCLRSDPRLPGIFREENLMQMAYALRRFLQQMLESELADDWPSMNVTASLAEGLSDELCQMLLKVLNPDPTEILNAQSDPVAAALDVLTDAGDSLGRHRFGTLLRDAFLNGGVARRSTTTARRGSIFLPTSGETGAGKVHDTRQSVVEIGIEESTVAASEHINVQNLESLFVSAEQACSVQATWKWFLEVVGSRRAASDRFAAKMEVQPSLKNMFKKPPPVIFLRFVNFLDAIVTAVSDSVNLKEIAEHLGFMHVHLEVTTQHVVTFREVVLDALSEECPGMRRSHYVHNSWRLILDYVGGALIYTRYKYAKRLRILETTWNTANATPEVDAALNDQYMDLHVPTTFDDMFRFNATVLGLSRHLWLSVVLDSFGAIVRSADQPLRLRIECDLLSLRLSQTCSGEEAHCDYSRFEQIMMASLRCLCSKEWGPECETAWSWLWTYVVTHLRKLAGKPFGYKKALGQFLDSLTDATRSQLVRNIFESFFARVPVGQDFFKQSATRLRFIAERVIEMALEIYSAPVKVVEEMSALGLRHVGYGIPSELIKPFSASVIEVFQGLLDSTSESQMHAGESFELSLNLVSRLLSQNIDDGSTLVMQAVNANSGKLLRKAVAHSPKKSRATWMLSVQVGIQTISPLTTALAQDRLDVAEAMIEDLLTIRADRESYYYGIDELFVRHPDIVQRIIHGAPTLWPRFLSGMVWRSRFADKGWRKVNYYIRHLLQTSNGDFAKTCEWMVEARNPKLTQDEIITILCDILWDELVQRVFLSRKLGLFLIIAVFIAGQSVLPRFECDADQPGLRVALWGCRAFCYAVGLPASVAGVRNLLRVGSFQDSFVIVGRITVPNYFRQGLGDFLKLVLIFLLCCMFILEPLLHRVAEEGFDIVFSICPDASSSRIGWYRGISTAVIFIYFWQLSDLCVISRSLSKFSLVCKRMVSEMVLCTIVSAYVLLTLSCTARALPQGSQEFNGVFVGSVSLIRVALGMASGESLSDFERYPALYVLILLFVICTVLLLFNLVVAQFTAALKEFQVDLDGIVCLNRLELIVSHMPAVSSRRWSAMLSKLHMEEPLQFEDGDVGLAGGIRVLEQANLHPTTKDTIRRFGGAVSPDMPWPVERAASTSEEERLDALESRIQKAMSIILRDVP